MSRIYDALKQAEKDRAAARQAQGNGAAVAPELEELFSNTQTSSVVTHRAVEVLDRPMAPQAAQPAIPAGRPETLSSAFSPPELQPAGPSAPAASFVSELPGVSCEWKPVLSSLPALEPRGSQVEQFRGLRSKLFEFRDLNTLKTLMVSSGRPTEGKSFVASNLALTLAHHRAARVLLIDGDMRRSSLHLQLGTTNHLGLADYLGGKATIQEILQHGTSADGAALPAGLATLSFIPAGNAGDKAADLSGTNRFKDLITLLTPHFDWIIVDSSPVNLVTDGINLARACDAVLLIVRAGLTRYETAQRAIAELKASKILGVVLNAVDESQKLDTYYGYDSQNTSSDAVDKATE